MNINAQVKQDSVKISISDIRTANKIFAEHKYQKLEIGKNRLEITNLEDQNFLLDSQWKNSEIKYENQVKLTNIEKNKKNSRTVLVVLLGILSTFLIINK